MYFTPKVGTVCIPGALGNRTPGFQTLRSFPFVDTVLLTGSQVSLLGDPGIQPKQPVLPPPGLHNANQDDLKRHPAQTCTHTHVHVYVYVYVYV